MWESGLGAALWGTSFCNRAPAGTGWGGGGGTGEGKGPKNREGDITPVLVKKEKNAVP